MIQRQVMSKLLKLGGQMAHSQIGVIRLASTTATSCKRLEGKVAIVTGSTDGIGFAVLKRLAHEGAFVVVSSRKQSNVDKAVKALQTEGLNKVSGVVCHVGKKEDRDALIKHTIDRAGGIDILVANAGMNPFFGRTLDTPEAAWDKVFDINLKSTFLLTQQIVPHIEQRGGGAIVYVSSYAGLIPEPALGAYSITKTALCGLTKVIAAECAPSNIRVNCIAPGLIKTYFSGTLWKNDDIKSGMEEKTMLKRLGEADEMGGLVAFLCSSDSSYITGEVVSITGDSGAAKRPQKMTDKEFAPLSSACVKALNDKIYEKRKTAALEIEKMVRDFHANENEAQIMKILKVLGVDFITGRIANPHSRKGGLIGLAATALGLGKDTGQYVEYLVFPIIECFKDPDSRVRYYACEAMYNVVKIARGSVLPVFSAIFSAVGKLMADPDQNVKNASELLDRLLKDIVTESPYFDLNSFMQLLQDRIYTKNQFEKLFIVSWISVLDSVPDINMLIFLPDLLDGLLCILEGPSADIRKSCESILGEFLSSIIANPAKVDFYRMVNILTLHSDAQTDVNVQITALTWIKEFINLSGKTMLPFIAGILWAVLPNVARVEDRKNVSEIAKAVLHGLMSLVTAETELAAETEESKKASTDENEFSKISEPEKLNLRAVIYVLTRNLIHPAMETRVVVLRWLHHLLKKLPRNVFEHVEEIFPILLKTLSDPSDEVVMLDLEILALISSSPVGRDFVCKMDMKVPEAVLNLTHKSPNINRYFTKFMVSLVSIFSTDRQLLDDRGSFITRQLCLLLNSEDIFRALSAILFYEEDIIFGRHMVQTLNKILLTSPELFELRNGLKDISNQDSCSLFECLYRSWCYDPVAVMSLCLLTQNYQHGCDLLQHFGNLEVTVDLLIEIDKLVQLIESPIFTYLRLQLLDANSNQCLIKSLYGILMLLPQSDAFHVLRNRLSCVPNVQLMPHEVLKTSAGSNKALKSINFDDLLQHFQIVQERYRKALRARKSQNASST